MHADKDLYLPMIVFGLSKMCLFFRKLVLSYLPGIYLEYRKESQLYDKRRDGYLFVIGFQERPNVLLDCKLNDSNHQPSDS